MLKYLLRLILITFFVFKRHKIRCKNRHIFYNAKEIMRKFTESPTFL